MAGGQRINITRTYIKICVVFIVNCMIVNIRRVVVKTDYTYGKTKTQATNFNLVLSESKALQA